MRRSHSLSFFPQQFTYMVFFHVFFSYCDSIDYILFLLKLITDRRFFDLTLWAYHHLRRKLRSNMCTVIYNITESKANKNCVIKKLLCYFSGTQG